MSTLSSQLTGTQIMELVDRFGRLANIDRSRAKRLLGDDDVMRKIGEMMGSLPSFRLIHDMYHPLEEKLEMVRSWPGVTAAMIDAAMKEARDSGRIERFEAESQNDRGLDIVVSVYMNDAPSTLAYARDRMSTTFGDRFWYHRPAFDAAIDHDRIRYLRDPLGDYVIVPVPRNRVRIELVDLFANWTTQTGTNWSHHRHARSAHFAVLYAAAQDPDWVWAMDGREVPNVVVGGLELNFLEPEWTDIPCIFRTGGSYRMGFEGCKDASSFFAMPELRE